MKENKRNLFQTIGFYVKDFFAHWNTPAKEGYYLSNKEFMAYAVGGMGVQGMGILTQYFAIANGLHLAYVYNFDQNIVLYTTWIVAILSLFRAPLIGWLVDNTNTKWGKYRPYLLFSGLLSVVCFWLLAFIPNMFMPKPGEPYTEKLQWTVVGVYQLIFFIAMTVYGLFSFGRVGLSQVITPNTNERTKLYSVGGVLDSLGPSIVQLFFPLIANWVYGPKGPVYNAEYGNMTAEELKALGESGIGFGMENIHTYQVIFPIFGCICVAVALIMFFGTKERIIQENSEVKKIGFMAGIAKSFKNKYFWIANISNVLGFGRIIIFGSVGYVCAYMIGGDLGGTLRGIMPTIAATGFVPGMLFAPLIQKHMGKKNMTLLSFGGSTVMSLLLLFLVFFAYESPVTPYVIFVGIFLNNIFSALWTVTGPAMTADYCEYQQWKTGDRLDAYMSQYSSVITTIAGMFTSLLTTKILVMLGAKDANNYADPTVMQNVFKLWAILGVVCGILAIIPYFFWDLTEEKQLKMANDLKIRTIKHKVENNTFTQEDVVLALECGAYSKEEIVDMGYNLEDKDLEVEQNLNDEINAVEQTGEEINEKDI